MPATLTVPAGSTVTWTNQDTAPHDVKTTSGPVSIHSPMLDKGESWTFTFGTAGSYGYYCTVHPDMTAGIAVQAATPTHSHHEAASTASSQGTSKTIGMTLPSASSKAPRTASPTPSKPSATATTPASAVMCLLLVGSRSAAPRE